MNLFKYYLMIHIVSFSYPKQNFEFIKGSGMSKKKMAKRRKFHRVTEEVIAMLEKKFPGEFTAICFEADTKRIVNGPPVFNIKIAAVKDRR